MQRNYRIGNDDFPAVVAVNPDGTPIGSGSSQASGGPATIADGADVAQGAKADALATNSTGSWSIVALLKGIYAQLVLTVAGLAAATPAGSNVIGKVQVADGGDLTQGAIADTLATNSTGSWSVVALLKGVYAQLVLSVTALNAATPAGSNVIGKVQVADGGDVAQGTTTDAAGTVTVIGLLRGVYGALTGFLKVQQVYWWQEASAASVAASAILAGTQRANPTASGSAGSFGYFQGIINSSTSGNFYILNGSGQIMAVMATSAGVPAILKVPALQGSFAVQFNNGGTAGSASMGSGYTAA